MTTQKRYLDYLQQVETILQETTIASTDCEILKNQIKNIELIVPVVGGFSAGKSTIINDFLGEKLLATNLTPETALATELHYSSSNYIEAIDDKGDITRYEISQTDQIKQNASQYQYLKFYINNEKIKQIQPLVLVDMPGFNAPLEQHNKAILNYLARGVHFIVAISAEDGTLQKNILREIQNILTFSKGLSVCLTKTNLKPSSDIEAIHQEISSLLQDYFDYNQKIYLLGKDASSEMQNMLTSISPNSLVEKIFLESLKLNQNKLISDINLQISTLQEDEQKIQKTIEALEEEIKILEQDKVKKAQELQNDYPAYDFERVVKKIGHEFFAQKEWLTSLMLENQDRFSLETSNIANHIMITELHPKLLKINTEILEGIKLDLGRIQDISINAEWITVLIEEAKVALNNLQNTQSDETQNKDKSKNKNQDQDKNQDLNLIEKITTTTILFAKKLHPIAVIALQVAPYFINAYLENKTRTSQKEEAIKYFTNSYIPEVQVRIRKKLKEMFESYVKEGVDKIYTDCERQIKQKREEMQAKQEEKLKHPEHTQEKIQKLVAIKNDLQNVEKKFLI